VQEIDGASNNSVEDIRTLRENVRYLPVRGKKKVYIIDEVHMLSTGAFNALLKTLEEPPPHAVFIFATTEVHKIPITILSRVQRYDFRLVSAQRIAQHLARVLTDEGIPFDKGALQVVAREAGGSVRDSLSLLEQVLAVGAAANIDDKAAAGAAVASEQAAADALGVADRGLVSELGRAILARDAAQALTLVAAACERNVDLKHLGQVLLEHLRNLVVARVVKEPSALIEASEMEIAELQAAARSAPDGLLPLVFDRATRLVPRT
jgi:DNA polymerase-3 subunit gamma/tau